MPDGKKGSATSGDGDSVQVKVVVVGDGAVGKTTMLVRYVENRFPETYVPTVFENYYQDVSIDDISVNLGLWDTAGQEDFDRLRSLSYGDTDLVLIVFAIDNPASLTNAGTKWVPEVQHHCHDVPFVLVGTKIDKRDDEETIEKLKARNLKMVERADAEAAVTELHAKAYMECSALTGEGVKEIFEKSLRIILGKQGRLSSKQKNSCCCIL